MVRNLSFWVMITSLAILASTPGGAQTASTKCDADTLSKTLHERMFKEGKTDAEISAILGSSFKRRVLQSRVVDGSVCTPEQAGKALDALKSRVAKS
jgi:hypothetical protein